MGARITGNNSRQDSQPLPSDHGSIGGGGSLFKTQLVVAGPVVLTGSFASVMGGGLAITAGPSGKVEATYTGVLHFVNPLDLVNFQFSRDAVNQVSSNKANSSPAAIGDTPSYFVTVGSTFLFEGLTPGASYTIDMVMGSSGAGDTAQNSVLVLTTY